MKTANSLITISFSQTFATKKNSRRKHTHKNKNELFKSFVKKVQTLLYSATAAVFTATLFLGGSYLFFIQLAEYGW